MNPSGLRTHNVVLFTLDGVRPQEIFGGLDPDLARSLHPERTVEKMEPYRRLWAETPEERRLRLMPFLWGWLVPEHGSIAGNAARGSDVHVTNRHRYSYAGYSEILTGAAHDDAIVYNDVGQNPFPSVLEFVRRRLDLDPVQVATFASWGALARIVERDVGTVLVNAGLTPYEHPDPAVQAFGRFQTETRLPWEDVRHDVYTFHLAMAHLRTHRPRVLFISLDETDDWAHDGNYGHVLEAIARADRYLEELWKFLHSDDAYRGRTTLIVTTDHGRGRTPDDWRHHGPEIFGSDEAWLAIAGPDSPARGEWEGHAPLTHDRIAATVAHLLGLDFTEEAKDAGAPMLELLG